MGRDRDLSHAPYPYHWVWSESFLDPEVLSKQRTGPTYMGNHPDSDNQYLTRRESFFHLLSRYFKRRKTSSLALNSPIKLKPLEMTIPTDQSEMSWQHLSLFSSPFSFGTNRLPPEELLCSNSGGSSPAAQPVPVPNVTGLQGPWRLPSPAMGLCLCKKLHQLAESQQAQSCSQQRLADEGPRSRLRAAAWNLAAHRPHPLPAGINGTKGE